MTNFRSADHPRRPAGDPAGGRFTARQAHAPVSTLEDPSDSADWHDRMAAIIDAGESDSDPAPGADLFGDPDPTCPF
ncbi:MAG: hypothetical protein CMH36_11960 [Microbacterium sp.]|jgi:hypothetical protein|uniref:Uncharacterized protein n=1 Tax=Microbacterium ginsengisoli TaxID=400772 RepID=A0A3C1KA28_9MICO|nr:hypothetical protein [uncultured Microbacterium sp.]MAL07521.1 hypothetical protein [Microbacterium sp.]HAN23492.1 hypothetical protein [Microbacterium ginsengisoli]